MINIKPQRKCNKCKKNFGKPPVLINKKSDIVEDYRDIATSIKFFVGGYMGTSYGGDSRCDIRRLLPDYLLLRQRHDKKQIVTI